MRREIKRRLSLLPREDFGLAGRRAVSFFRSSSFWAEYKTFLVFMSAENEIDTGPLLSAALEDGKAVFAPRVEHEKMNFYRVKSIDGPWNAGAFGIREPLTSEDNILKKSFFPALIFTPGLAFDRRGNRLGRGRAYYDRFFEETENLNLEYFSAGLCLEIQVLPSVPVEKWDRPVKYLGSF